MAYQNPAFYYYHAGRSATSVTANDLAPGAPAANVTYPIYDSRQGELFTFDTSFNANQPKDVNFQIPVTAENDAIDTLILSGHNMSTITMRAESFPGPVTALNDTIITEPDGTLVIRTLDTITASKNNLVVEFERVTGGAGAVIPQLTELWPTTLHEMTRGPRPNWNHSWVRSQTRFVNDAGVSSVRMDGAARKTYRITWAQLFGEDRQILFDLQDQSADWSQPFFFRPPDDDYPTILVELDRDENWEQDFLNPLQSGTSDRVTMPMIEVLA